MHGFELEKGIICQDLYTTLRASVFVSVFHPVYFFIVLIWGMTNTSILTKGNHTGEVGRRKWRFLSPRGGANLGLWDKNCCTQLCHY